MSVSPERESLADGDPDGLTPTLGLDNLLLQAMNPDARVKDFADFTVLTNEYATFGVFRAVACMDADALELRYTEQDGKPLLHLRTPRNHHSIAAFGDGRAAFHLVASVRIVAPSGFEGVTEILALGSCQILVIYAPLNVEPTDGVGLALCYTF